MSSLLERALEQVGCTKNDVKKHVRNGASLTDLESFIENYEGGLNEWEDAGITKEEFIERFENASKDISNFFGDTDLVIIDGEKYLIEYVL